MLLVSSVLIRIEHPEGAAAAAPFQLKVEGFGQDLARMIAYLDLSGSPRKGGGVTDAWNAYITWSRQDTTLDVWEQLIIGLTDGWAAMKVSLLQNLAVFFQWCLAFLVLHSIYYSHKDYSCFSDLGSWLLKADASLVKWGKVDSRQMDECFELSANVANAGKCPACPESYHSCHAPQQGMKLGQKLAVHAALQPSSSRVST